MKQLSLNFAALLSEGLPYVDGWTPTEINEGGCGIFAELLAKELAKHDIPYKIYAISTGTGKEETKHLVNLTRYLKTGKITNKDYTGPAHVVVQIQDLYFDSTGIVNMQTLFADKKIEMTLSQLEGLNQRGGWSPVFDRDCVPEIEKRIAEVFTHIDDFKSGMFKYPGEKEVELTEHTRKQLRRKAMGSFMAQVIHLKAK